jgi:hypothetical protein
MRVPHLLFFSLCTSALFVILLNGDGRIESTITGVDAKGRVETLKDAIIMDPNPKGHNQESGEPRMILSGSEIYRFEPLTVMIRNLSGVEAAGLYLQVTRDGKVQKSGDGLAKLPVLPDPNGNEGWHKAVYLPDFNERAGTYEIAAYNAGGEIVPFRAAFTIKKRQLPPVKKGLAVVDLEMNASVRRKSFLSPDGTEKDCSALLEWVRFMDADALWILSGETTGFQVKSPSDDPWDHGPLDNLAALKGFAPKFGVDIGAYIMCFYVPGYFGVPPRYEAAMGYDSSTDTLYRAKHISLDSERRILDIIELARRFQADPYIHYIGFDFIRTGKTDGYELAEDVVRVTNAQAPENWETLSRVEKIRWFARKIEMEKDPLLIEKWRWWRAHKVAGIIKRVIEEAGITKPVWVYTLGWNHGKEHGQDPVMFFDAGVSIDAVMLYEATREQFKNLLPQWKSYLRAQDGNIIVGNCVDEKLLDSDTLTPPDELFRRNVEGYRNIMQGGFARGLFFHDLSRAFWGRRGVYSTSDYATAFQSSVYSLRKELQVAGLVVDLVVQDTKSDAPDQININGFIQVRNPGAKTLDKVVIELVDPQLTSGLNYFYNETRYENGSRFDMGELASLESKRVEFAISRERDFPSTGRIRFKVEISGKKVYYITELVRSS